MVFLSWRKISDRGLEFPERTEPSEFVCSSYSCSASGFPYPPGSHFSFYPIILWFWINSWNFYNWKEPIAWCVELINSCCSVKDYGIIQGNYFCPLEFIVLLFAFQVLTAFLAILEWIYKNEKTRWRWNGLPCIFIASSTASLAHLSLLRQHLFF